MNKKLYKSEDNKVLCGVCGGLGEFLGIDPTDHPTDLGGTCICSRKRITDLSSGQRSLFREDHWTKICCFRSCIDRMMLQKK